LNKEILIYYVEDEALTRLLVEKFLNKFFDLKSFENGYDAWEACKNEIPDCLITDLSVPKMSGFELIKNLRGISDDVKIIITSAYREEAEALCPNVEEIFTKPLECRELVETVKRLFPVTAEN